MHRALDAVMDAVDIRRVEAALVPHVPDAGDRAFLLRCMLDEGPHHHRAANAVLLRLLADVAARVPMAAAPEGPATRVRMRLPPHLLDRDQDTSFPVGLPQAAVARVAAPGTDAHRAVVDMLMDGPPQHALANVVMVTLLHRILLGLEAPRA